MSRWRTGSRLCYGSKVRENLEARPGAPEPGQAPEAVDEALKTLPPAGKQSALPARLPVGKPGNHGRNGWPRHSRSSQPPRMTLREAGPDPQGPRRPGAEEAQLRAARCGPTIGPALRATAQLPDYFYD